MFYKNFNSKTQRAPKILQHDFLQKKYFVNHESAYYCDIPIDWREKNMCEFNVILDGKVQFKDAIYAKIEGTNVIAKNVLGEAKEFKNAKIVEVDVNTARLILSNLKP